MSLVAKGICRSGWMATTGKQEAKKIQKITEGQRSKQKGCFLQSVNFKEPSKEIRPKQRNKTLVKNSKTEPEFARHYVLSSDVTSSENDQFI